jgi:branched-chain amino acid transport system permease protein
MRTPYASALQTAVILIAAVAIVTVLGLGASGSTQRVLTDAMLKMTIVIGLYVFVGNSGILSFGHIGFLGVGAYTFAWLTIPPGIKQSLLPGLPEVLATAELSPLAAVPLSGLAAAAVALVFGLPLTRLQGIAASIGTFAMLIILYSVFANWTPVTGGQGSLYGLPIFVKLPQAATLTAIAILCAALYQASASGFRLRGSREDAVAAQAAGVNIRRERLVAFVASAAIVGMAGALHASFLQVVVANEFYLKMTFITVAMLIIGGMRSLTGAVVGTAAVAFLSEMLRQAERGVEIGPLVFAGRPGMQEVGLALAMLLVLILRPDGITRGREIALPNRRQRQTERKSDRSSA